jgi:hypothetical protein
MIRNLKALLAAALALAAIGALSASGAQAASFHCNTNPCRGTLKPDGTGTTAHHVFVLETENTSNSVSFTCSELQGEARVEAEEAATVAVGNLNYPTAGCKVNGSSGVTFDMNGCRYSFTASGATTGTISVVGCTNAAKAIEITITGGCVFSIPESAVQNLAGIDFHNLGVAPNREVTVEVRHVTIKGITANAACEPLIGAGHLTGLVATYETGNTIVTGETDEANPVMKDEWFG